VDAEQVLITVNLKFGGKVYDKGSILSAPLPPEIIAELRSGSKSITILKRIVPIEKPKILVEPEVIPPKSEPKVPIPPPPAGKLKRGRRKKLK
jgi:hypothetical protein